MKSGSILNDVLGPVMTGPSSSHTAAPGKIGLTVRNLWGGAIPGARVVYDAGGSYPGTHVGQGSDFGFAGGLLGLAADDPRFRDALELAQERAVPIRFDFENLGTHHPNEARLDVPGDGKPALSVLSYSTGGGTFRLVEMDGFPIDFDGQREKLYLACSAMAADAAENALRGVDARFCRRTADPARTTYGSVPADAVLFEIEAQSHPQMQLPAGAAAQALYLRRAQPVVPAPLRLDPAASFATADGAARYARENGLETMAQLALRYECGLSSLPEADIRAGMTRVLQAMRTSMQAPPADDPVQNLLIPRYAAGLHGKKLPLDLGVLNPCMETAVAVMENSCAHRAVVAAPTAGSSGVIPAAVVAAGTALGRTDAEILDALWAAGLVGALIANQATFGAEVAGCQAEIGAAACMAAAGVVQLMGGSIACGFDAACIAMQSFLGLICDPIAGLTEFPCIERNVTAAAAAVMAANMALCGMTSLVPLDETLQTMLRVGESLPAQLRCTCQGGLCATETGRACQARVEKMHK